MSDSFTETTHTSWFSRIKSALGGIFGGLLLVIAAVAALFWNEGRAVKTANALNEGAGQVMTIDPANLSADSSGKLVHFSGILTPNGVAQDNIFVGIQAPDGATRLERKVEMYQWEQRSKTEKQKKLGGGEETVTTYTYQKVWSERPIDSSRFKRPNGHQNPQISVESAVFGVENGNVGQINLKGSSFQNLGEKTPITLSDEQVQILKNQFAGKAVSKDGAGVSVKKRFGFEAIGDLRISYYSADVEQISVVGKLDNGTITPFETSNGRKLSMFRSGEASAKEMFDDALSSNTLTTWLLRLGGFIAMLVGFKMMLSIIGVLGDVVPFVGDVFRFATGLAAFAVTAVLSTLVIGFAWIYFRPVVGISIIVAGLILAIGSMVIGKAKAKKQAELDGVEAA